jgi:hypothetical protein
MTTPTEGRFDLLPVISEAVTEHVFKEIEQFNRLAPAAQSETLAQDMELLHAHDPELAHAIEGVIEGPIQMDFVADKLAHSEWLHLRYSLIHGFTAVLRALNEARREERG